LLKKSSISLSKFEKELVMKFNYWERRDPVLYNLPLMMVRKVVKETSLKLAILKGVRLLTLSSLKPKVLCDEVIEL
jgi:hypothetical protein